MLFEIDGVEPHAEDGWVGRPETIDPAATLGSLALRVSDLDALLGLEATVRGYPGALDRVALAAARACLSYWFAAYPVPM